MNYSCYEAPSASSLSFKLQTDPLEFISDSSSAVSYLNIPRSRRLTLFHWINILSSFKLQYFMNRCHCLLSVASIRCDILEQVDNGLSDSIWFHYFYNWSQFRGNEKSLYNNLLDLLEFSCYGIQFDNLGLSEWIGWALLSKASKDASIVWYFFAFSSLRIAQTSGRMKSRTQKY